MAFLVGLALSVAASASFPVLLLSLTWRRFSTTGALAGIAFGLVTSLVLIVMSPAVWPGPDGEGSPFRAGLSDDDLDPGGFTRLLARNRAVRMIVRTLGPLQECSFGRTRASVPNRW